MLLPLASLFLLAATAPLLHKPVSHSYAAAASASPPFAVLWHAGNFRYLDAMSGDLITFVQGFQHPNTGGYGKLSSTRKANFNAFQDALFAAIDASLADGSTGDWCGLNPKPLLPVMRSTDFTTL